jgi:hypothetical protein
LRIVQAFSGQRINIAKNVAEFIVEKRSLNAVRQRVANISDLLADLVEHLGHLL